MGTYLDDMPDLIRRRHYMMRQLYDSKDFKQALSLGEGILASYPDNGETIAMKGLILRAQDKKEEAYELLKLGIRYCVKSSACWHFYGLVHRADRNYVDAKKAFQMALKLCNAREDPYRIMNDLAQLQIQVRDIKGFRDLREQMMRSSRNSHSDWLAFAVANQALGNHELAIKTLELFITETAERAAGITPLNKSSVILYIAELYFEAGRYGKGMDRLQKWESEVLDKTQWREYMAKFYFKLNKFEASKKLYLDLVKINPDVHAYHAGIQRALGRADGQAVADIPAEAIAAILEQYKELRELYPKSIVTTVCHLELLSGDDFVRHVGDYLRKALRKGVPAVFRNLKAIYKADPQKVQAIQDLMLSYRDSLATTGRFHDDDATETLESPAVAMYVDFFLAQHFDKLRLLPRAMHHIQAALAHTPTYVENYMIKARILKHGGDLEAAVDAMNTARKLDLADRYVNTKCTLYMLRANKVAEAEATMTLFTKDEKSLDTLFDVQCMWYECEMGKARLRRGEYGPALKMFSNVDKHFEDISEDQFDFHSYCLRKFNVKPYVDLLRFEDSLFDKDVYCEAAKGIVEIYLKLHDDPSIKDVPDEFKIKEETPEEKEQKALEKKKKKEEEAEKKAKEAASSSATSTSSSGKGRKHKKRGGKKNKKDKDEDEGGETKAEDDEAEDEREPDKDPYGTLLLQEEKPLDKASKVLEHMRLHLANRIETHVLAFEVFTRLDKPMLVLHALKRAVAIDAAHPSTLELKIKFAEYAGKCENSIAAEILAEERAALVGSKKPVQLATEYIAAHAAADPAKALGGYTALIKLDKSKVAAAEKALASARIADRDLAVRVHGFLKDTVKSTKAAKQFAEAHKEAFPLSSYFREA